MLPSVVGRKPSSTEPSFRDATKPCPGCKPEPFLPGSEPSRGVVVPAAGMAWPILVARASLLAQPQASCPHAAPSPHTSATRPLSVPFVLFVPPPCANPLRIVGRASRLPSCCSHGALSPCRPQSPSRLVESPSPDYTPRHGEERDFRCEHTWLYHARRHDRRTVSGSEHDDAPRRLL